MCKSYDILYRNKHSIHEMWKYVIRQRFVLKIQAGDWLLNNHKILQSNKEKMHECSSSN